MKRNDIHKILWLVASTTGAVGILGHYKIVIIKYISDFNFEMLLIGFIALLVLRLMKK